MCYPPPAHAFGAHLAQNRALLRVGRTGVLLTSVFVGWMGLRAPLTPKVCGFVVPSRVHILKTIVNVDSKSKLRAPEVTFEVSAAVL